MRCLIPLGLSACVLIAPRESTESPDDPTDVAGTVTLGTSDTSSTTRPTGAPCPALTADDTSLDGYEGLSIAWQDAACTPRTAHLVHNDREDPSGHFGGYLRRLTYQDRTIDGSFDRHPGFGYAVSHFDSTATLSYDYAGTWSTPLLGRHHLRHVYTVQQPIDGFDVAVTLQWFFATGWDHPIWSITYDTSSAPADAVAADSRSPYGDLQWDAGAGVDVDGVGWGDHYRFRSTTAPITLDSGWDYSQPNRIPHVLAWSVGADAEMGTVQTQSQTQHAAGGYWFFDAWGTADPDGPMPPEWNWTFQLNQYELPWGSGSKRVAWGMNYGAVGQDAYPDYGYSGFSDGYPYQSYSVHVVLGRHTDAVVDEQVAQVEALLDATVTAQQGTLRSSGPGGVGRSDAVTWDPAGYDPTVAGFHVEADGDAASLAITIAQPWRSPLFVVHGLQVHTVVLDDQPLQLDEEVYVTQDGDTAWITLSSTLDGTHELEVR
ncbi:MAG: hypothetical protein KTR31_36405 [Myxococcales bacterium]|nr:hypothetical protein [Myxococcales bacterium]